MVAVSARPWESGRFDEVSYLATKRPLLALGAAIHDRRMFGRMVDVDQVRFLAGSAGGFGGLPETEAYYSIRAAPQPVGRFRLTVGDVPVDAFWSISVYGRRLRRPRSSCDVTDPGRHGRSGCARARADGDAAPTADRRPPPPPSRADGRGSSAPTARPPRRGHPRVPSGVRRTGPSGEGAGDRGGPRTGAQPGHDHAAPGIRGARRPDHGRRRLGQPVALRARGRAGWPARGAFYAVGVASVCIGWYFNVRTPTTSASQASYVSYTKALFANCAGRLGGPGLHHRERRARCRCGPSSTADASRGHPVAVDLLRRQPASRAWRLRHGLLPGQSSSARSGCGGRRRPVAPVPAGTGADRSVGADLTAPRPAAEDRVRPVLVPDASGDRRPRARRRGSPARRRSRGTRPDGPGQPAGGHGPVERGARRCPRWASSLERGTPRPARRGRGSATPPRRPPPRPPTAWRPGCPGCR